MQILKQDWPSKWPTFITDIVNASKTSELLCENSMVILKLLSEEIFDFSRGELTTVGTFCVCCLLFCRLSVLAQLLGCLSSQPLSLAAMPYMGSKLPSWSAQR